MNNNDSERFRKYYSRSTPFTTPFSVMSNTTPRVNVSQKRSTSRSNSNDRIKYKNKKDKYYDKDWESNDKVKDKYKYRRGSRSKSRSRDRNKNKYNRRSRSGSLSRNRRSRSRSGNRSKNKYRNERESTSKRENVDGKSYYINTNNYNNNSYYGKKQATESETNNTEHLDSNIDDLKRKKHITNKGTSFTPLFFKGSVNVNKDKVNEPETPKIAPKESKPSKIAYEGVKIEEDDTNYYISTKNNKKEFRKFDDEYAALEWENFDKAADRQWYDQDEINQVVEENNPYVSTMGGPSEKSVNCNIILLY